MFEFAPKHRKLRDRAEFDLEFSRAQVDPESVPTPYTKLLDELSHHVYHDRCKTIFAPLEFLKPEHDIDEVYRPRLLCYGVPITRETLDAYTKKHGFWPENPSTTIPYKYYQQVHKAYRKSLDKISDAAEFTLDLRYPYSIEYDMVIALYSNYRIERVIIDEDSEQEVIDTIRNELGLDSDRRPLWWFDEEEFDDAWIAERERIVRKAIKGAGFAAVAALVDKEP